MNNFWVAFCAIVYAILCIASFLIGLESMMGMFKNVAPAVSAGRPKRDGVTKQIQSDLPDAKTILDIGCGWGAMIAAVARKFPNAKITGIEMMLTPYIVSKIRFMFRKNVKIIYGDAFKYLKNKDQKFDIGITYLLTPEMKDVEKFIARFKILLSVDFPLPNLKPASQIKLHRDRHAQHWLYVYKK